MLAYVLINYVPIWVLVTIHQKIQNKHFYRFPTNCINLLFRQAIIQLFIDGFDVFITTRGVIALNKNE